MTVAELINILKGYDQSLQVARPLYSEYCILQERDIIEQTLGEVRNDGWIADYRRDKNGQIYLVIG